MEVSNMEEVTSRTRPMLSMTVDDEDEVFDDEDEVFDDEDFVFDDEDFVFDDEDAVFDDEDEVIEDEDMTDEDMTDEDMTDEEEVVEDEAMNMTDEDKEKLMWTTRHELEPKLKKLEQKLKKYPKLDLVDILFSKRFRKSVLLILDWMLNHDFARVAHVVYPKDAMGMLGYNPSTSDITLLGRAISYMAKFIRDSVGKHDHDRPSNMHDLNKRYLFYPLGYLNFSRDNDDLLKDVAGLGPYASLPMGLDKDYDNEEMGSRALNVQSLIHHRCPLIRNCRNSCLVCPEALSRKYVLVCCINVPFESADIQSLFNLCHELSSLKRKDVEIVIVVRIHILFDAPDLFQHVLKQLPPSCLVVPRESWKSRERIYKALGFGTEEEFKVFVYNREGLFSSTFCANIYENPYGAEAFPFTKERMEKVQRERVALREGRSLVELLRPSYEGHPKQDVVVYEFNQGGDGPKQPISQVIKGKHVGLYMCCGGLLIHHFHELYKQCKERKEDFEIVVLYQSPQSNKDPDSFKEETDGLLQKHEGGGHGWWCLPFNHSVSLRFLDLTKDYAVGYNVLDEDQGDKLIIVGRDGKILDMYGAQVIVSHGIDGNYPFTRAAFVEKRMRELRRCGGKLLEKLWKAQLFRGNAYTHVISGRALFKRKVIIYMGKALDYTANGRRYSFERLVNQYKQMKKDLGDDEFEVVFVEYPIPYRKATKVIKKFDTMPWYVHCPVNGTYTDLGKQLRATVGQVQALIGFDEEGRICSYKLPQIWGMSTGLCLEDTLFDDLYEFYGFTSYRDII